MTINDQFQQTFGAAPDIIVRSPGRVNLIGEHTDYNDGWVFPAALEMGTTVAARRRDDGVIHTVALRMDGEDRFNLSVDQATDVDGWARYVRGVAQLLHMDGCPLPGAELLIDGDIPLGSGLSSSASLELGVAVALAELAGYAWDPKALAQLGQRAENQIVGVQTGIMDQLAAACGVAGHALLIDCRSLEVQPVPIPPEVRILVLDTSAPRSLAGSAYNQRRADCESAVARLKAVDPSITALRDVTAALLDEHGHLLTPVELRRARHIVTENARVLDGVEALRRGDAEELGRLMVASHASLRDDYEVSGLELNMMVEVALDTPGVLGARMTGGGFGGCCVALVAAEAAEQAAEQIIERYSARSAREGHAYISTPSDGARPIEGGAA